MPTDLADQCKAYHAKIEQSIDNLLKINQELWQEHEQLIAEITELKTQPIASNEPDIRDQIIALIAPAIEFKEQFYVNGEYKELVTLYREYRPKEVNGNEHKTL
jgi:hypothetical protein